VRMPVWQMLWTSSSVLGAEGANLGIGEASRAAVSAENAGVLTGDVKGAGARAEDAHG
jgi:hypothetical protein